MSTFLPPPRQYIFGIPHLGFVNPYQMTHKHKANKTRSWHDLGSGVLSQDFSPLFDGLRKRVESGDSILPADTSISDTDTVLEAALAFLGHLLVTCTLC